MEPASIVKRDGFNVLGVQRRIDPMAADYPALWENESMPRHGEISALAGGEEGRYAAYFGCEEAGKVDFVAGMAVDEVEAVPDGLVLRQVPAAEFAVFESTMPMLAATWGAIYSDWFAGSREFEPDESKACYEYFPPGVHEGRAPVSVCVAVKRT